MVGADERTFEQRAGSAGDLPRGFPRGVLAVILRALLANSSRIDLIERRLENPKNRAVYKIVYGGVTAKPEMRFMCLKRLVGERGFEPPTPWSRSSSGCLTY